MAYFRTWNSAYELSPDGGDQRSTADDRIRELKVDTRERMESLANWSNTDPVALKSSAPVSHTGKVLYVHASDMQSFGEQGGGASETSSADGVLNWLRGGIYYNNVYGAKLFRGIMLPIGTVIESIEARLFNPNAVALPNTIALRYTTWGTEEQVNAPLSLTQSVSSGVGATLSLATHTLAAGRNYYLYAFLTASAGKTCEFNGFKITYTVPTLAQLR